MYVYHLLSENFQGQIIYPLTQLEKFYPLIAKQCDEKYEWRVEIKKRYLSQLKAYWNDVVHLSTLCPQKTYDQLKKLGISQFSSKEYVKIPVSILDEQSAVLFNPSQKMRSDLSVIHDEELSVFSKANYVEVSEVSQNQIDLWQRNLQEKTPMLLFSQTQHLLYKGNIDMSQCERFRVL